MQRYDLLYSFLWADWLFSNPPEADYSRNDYTGFHKNVPNGISGCKKNVRITEHFFNNHYKALTCFSLSPPPWVGNIQAARFAGGR
jgi:hypothetical protein